MPFHFCGFLWKLWIKPNSLCFSQTYAPRENNGEANYPFVAFLEFSLRASGAGRFGFQLLPGSHDAMVILAPFPPQREHRADWRSMSLDASLPQRIT
jgi:hypothetical protein